MTQGTLLPRRQIIQNRCGWVYKGPDCGWVPSAGKYFDADDNSVATLAEDVCGYRLKSCNSRFGKTGRGTRQGIPFGAEPGVGLIQQ